MGKLKGPSHSYVISSIVFWVLFIGLVIYDKILIGVFDLTSKDPIATISFPNFIGIFILLGLFISLVLMLIFSTLLFMNSQYAAAMNYKAEASWAITVFVFNILFTAIFVSWFVVNILFNVSEGGIPADRKHPAILLDKIITEIQRTNEDGVLVKIFAIKISTVINWLAVFGVFSAILSLSLSIAIAGRASNVNKKIKEYERVNIY